MIPETQTYIDRFREMRGSLFKILEGLDSAGLNWEPARRDTNSLYAQATHLAGSERHWIHRIIGNRVIQRDRDAEFRARGSDTSALRLTFAEIAQESEKILGELSPAALDAVRETNQGPSSIRWCVLHLLEHYAEHEGQMSLTRQMWEERTKSVRHPAESQKRGSRKKLKTGKRPKATIKAKRKK